MIPKIIHYCWLSGDEFPKHIENNIASWRTMLPDYEFIMWDAERFDLPRNTWVDEAIECKKFAFASDFIRMYALYTYGGIYLDTDVEILKSFDDILDLPYFIGSQHNKMIEAAIIGAKKQSDWVLNCMQHYDHRPFIKEDGSFDMVVLPFVIKNQIEDTRNLTLMQGYEAQMPQALPKNRSALYLFPFDYFCCKNYETGEIVVTDNTYTIHHFNSAWLPMVSKMRRKIIRTIGVQSTERILELTGLRKLVKVLRLNYRNTG